jgi:hypothetical protein
MEIVMYLYLKRMRSTDSGEEFLKVGVSDSPDVRFSFGRQSVKESALPLGDKVRKLLGGQKYIPDHPDQVQDVHTVSFTYEGDALIAEREILRRFRNSRHRPEKWFSGGSECIEISPETAEIILRIMNEQHDRAREAEPDQLIYKVCSLEVRGENPIDRHLKIVQKCRDYEQSRSG